MAWALAEEQLLRALSDQPRDAAVCKLLACGALW